MTRKTAFFEGWSWLKFNNLGLALGTNLKFYTRVAKGLKIDGPEVTKEKLVGAAFLAPLILNRVKRKVLELTALIFLSIFFIISLNMIFHMFHFSVGAIQFNVAYWAMKFNPIHDGSFWGCSWIGGRDKQAPLPTICYTYSSTMMKLGTLIPYLKKINEIYKLRDTPLKFCWHHHFFTGNRQMLQYQQIQI